MPDFCSGIIGCLCPQVTLEASIWAPVFLIKEQNNHQGQSRGTVNVFAVLLISSWQEVAGMHPCE